MSMFMIFVNLFFPSKYVASLCITAGVWKTLPQEWNGLQVHRLIYSNSGPRVEFVEGQLVVQDGYDIKEFIFSTGPYVAFTGIWIIAATCAFSTAIIHWRLNMNALYNWLLLLAGALTTAIPAFGMLFLLVIKLSKRAEKLRAESIGKSRCWVSSSQELQQGRVA
eukprot:TRINITY_DN20665_c0_g1_i2.p1 TRINITY_DN20665_c0_g1~~TRINITY_DN20665_c0_g1_i2.p1  ORF type:complete len:173 (-),score=12.77 TRINITY_DN20665_c0_g1_i2:156-650(-)